jgi:pimeloyl-ACP methyl ester carboxylesterase
LSQTGVIGRRAFMAGLTTTLCAAAKPGSAETFIASDGVRLHAHSFGRGQRAVILVPGAHGIGDTWEQQARRLATAGFHVLALDYRGLGRSQGPQDDAQTHLDVLSVIRTLKAQGAKQIALVGASWGGRAAALAAIAAPDLVDRLVLLAHSPIDNPERLSCPKLFIAGKDDRDGSGRLRLDSIRDQFRRAPEPKRLVVLDGAAHAQFLFLTRSGERLYSEIAGFLLAR